MARKPKEAPAREVRYPDLTVNGYKIDPAKCIITREQNLELLGWEAAPQLGAFGEDFLLIDDMGRQIRLRNNLSNREFRNGDMLLRLQDFLNNRYELNGETAIIGEYGDTLSYQHRGIAYELAWQRWEGWLEGKLDEDRAAAWKARLPDGPMFRTLLVKGVKQTPEVIRSIDSVVPRTDTDVIYTSGLFNHLPPKPRGRASRSMAYAVRLVWHRAGQEQDAFAPHRTNSEIMDYVNRHRKLVDCVSHIAEEDGDGRRISRYVAPGIAAGLLYLMGCSGADGDKYRNKDVKSEDGLGWKYWTKAKEFWTAVAGEDKGLAPLFVARRPVEGESKDPKASDGLSRVGYVFGSSDAKGGSNKEKIGVLIKAWNEFSEGNRVTPGSIKLEYGTAQWRSDNTLDSVNLVEYPRMGGIDLPPPVEQEEEEAESPEAVTDQAAEQQEIKEEKAAQGKAPPLPPGAAERAQLDGMRAAHPGTLLLFKSTSTYGAYEEDATTLGSLLGLAKRKTPAGLLKAEFAHSELEPYLAKLHAEGLTVGSVSPKDGSKKDGELEVTVLKPRLKAPPRPLNRPPAVPIPKEANGTEAAPGSAPKGKMRKAPVPLRGGIGN